MTTTLPSAEPTTRAILLRSVDYRESDRIVTLFTEEQGKTSAIARAARASHKRFGGALQSLCVIDVRLERGRGDLQVVHEARVLSPCLGVLASLARIEAAGAGLEMLRFLLADRHPEPEVFGLCVGFLEHLDAGHDPPTRLLQFQMDTLERLGFSPELSACGVCGKAAPSGRAALFRPSAGAIVCRACGGGALRLSAGTRETLLSYRAAGEAEGAESAWPDAVVREGAAMVRSILQDLGAR